MCTFNQDRFCHDMAPQLNFDQEMPDPKTRLIKLPYWHSSLVVFELVRFVYYMDKKLATPNYLYAQSELRFIFGAAGIT